MYPFTLPDVGEGIHEAEVVRWLVKTGESIAQDQPMVEIQTDKALVEIPSPVAGRVAEIKALAGHVAHVGEVLIVLETAPMKPTNGQPQVGIARAGERVLAAPAVRKIALEHGIDLRQLSGSGEAGRVLLSDVQAAMAQKTAPSPVEKTAPPSPPQVEANASAPIVEQTETLPLQGLRRRIAERMAEAWRIPHVTSFDEVELSELVALRAELKPFAEAADVKLTYLPFFIKAVILTLRQFPDFNASLDMAKQEIHYHKQYHIGLATAVDEGLLVPVIHQADRYSLLDLAREISRLSSLAQTRRLSLADLTGSTFSLTNFGSMGGLQGTPIINPPEVAILGCGRIEERVIPVDGQPAIRPVMGLALSFDHRLIDGATAARFLNHLKSLLHQPKRLFLEM